MMRKCDYCHKDWERVLLEPFNGTDDRGAFVWICPDCYEEYLAELTSGYQ